MFDINKDRVFPPILDWDYAEDRKSGHSSLVCAYRGRILCIYDVKPIKVKQSHLAVAVDVTARAAEGNSRPWLAHQLLREHIDAAESDPLKVMQCQLT